VTYPDSVRFLYSLGNEIKTAKLGLDRIRVVLDALGHPEQACRFVHVAGTNGKGSTCAMIEAGLRASGVSTGLYISPHLSEPVERIQVCGRAVSSEQFSRAFDQVHAVSERLLAAGGIDAHPTYFESVTAMAFVLFRELRAGTVVLETGLGGRLDATNVVSPALTVITPIDFDHEQFLGHTLEAIAGEKAGILKSGVPAIFARQRSEALQVLLRRAGELNVPVTCASSAIVEDVRIDERGSSFRMNGDEIRCPLAGEHQVENAVTAALALRQLGCPPGGIAETKWPGRLEWVSVQPAIILDGAHNPAGARALAAYIRQFFANRRVWIVYGTMRDKAVDEITGTLFPLAAEVIVTASHYARSLRPEAVAAMAHDSRVRTTASVEEAIALVRRAAQPDDAVFVTGSLFVVGEARELLLK
jgi:dihydrofolate synthase/folylpolyglutamate synthase